MDKKDDVENRVKRIIDANKEEEALDAASTRNNWKMGFYTFEILTYIFSFIALCLTSASTTAIFSDYSSLLAYLGIVSHTFHITTRGLSTWCSKKFTEQATIVNSIIESIKTGKMPTVTLTPSDNGEFGSQKPLSDENHAEVKI